MSLHTQILLASLIIFSVGIPFVINRRSGQKMGCLTYGYISLVVFMITGFTIALSVFFTQRSINDGKAIIAGQYYDAVISEYREDGNEIYTAYYSLVNSSEDTIMLESKYTIGDKPIIGDTIPLYYNETTHTHVELSASFYIMTIGLIIMWLALVMVFCGIVWYALALDMSKFFEYLKKVLMNIFLPLVIISFEALLIYAFFYGNEVPWFVKGLLAFFILILGLVILGMIKKQTENWLKPQNKPNTKKNKKSLRNKK